MFKIENKTDLNEISDMYPDSYSCGSYRKKEILVKENITIYKNKNYIKSEFDFIIDTLNLLKISNNSNSKIISYNVEDDKLIISLKYQENSKNISFVDSIKVFIDKYKNKNKYCNNIINL